MIRSTISFMSLLMKNISLYLLLISLLFSASTVAPLFASATAATLYVVPVSGMVEPGMAAYIERTLTEIEDNENGVIVFKLDSFGGRVDAALDIVDVISSIPKVKTVAYVDKRAISAGALIALSANQLFMRGNTLIGDCAPIIQTQDF